jgi:hypothetical protein
MLDILLGLTIATLVLAAMLYGVYRVFIAQPSPVRIRWDFR